MESPFRPSLARCRLAGDQEAMGGAAHDQTARASHLLRLHSIDTQLSAAIRNSSAKSMRANNVEEIQSSLAAPFLPVEKPEISGTRLDHWEIASTHRPLRCAARRRVVPRSTHCQGRSGRGVEGPRASVERTPAGFEILAEDVEIEAARNQMRGSVKVQAPPV